MAEHLDRSREDDRRRAAAGGTGLGAGSLLSVPTMTEAPAPSEADEPQETPLLRKLAGRSSPDAGKKSSSPIDFRAWGRGRGRSTATILEARAPKTHASGKSAWNPLTSLKAKLMSSDTDHEDSSLEEPDLVEPQGDDDAAWPDRMTGLPAEGEAKTLSEAERRLEVVGSRAGWLLGELERCQSALDDALTVIHREELRVARLRGVEEGRALGAEGAAASGDAEEIRRRLKELRRMLKDVSA